MGSILRSSISFYKLEFDVVTHRKDVEEDLHNAMVKIITVWTRAALKAVDGSFPVKTGMAKASFSALVEFLRSEGKRVAFDFSSVDYDAVVIGKKSRGMGAAQSKKSNFIVVLRNQYGPFRFTFDWWTEVEHFIRNETDPEAKRLFKLIHQTPWNVIPQANDAAKKYLPVALKQVRSLKKYLHVIPPREVT